MNYEVSVNGQNVRLMLSNQVKLEVLEEELKKCQALGGYMASANVVQSYLEKRVFALENAVKHEKRIEDSLDAFDGQTMNDSEDNDFVEYKIEYTHEERVRCSDDGEHPLVYYTVPKGGSVQCGYCNRKWIRK